MLPESERNILILTGARLLMATAEPHVYEAGNGGILLRRPWLYGKRKDGNRCRVKELERLYRATLKKKPDSDDENELVLDVPDLPRDRPLKTLLQGYGA